MWGFKDGDDGCVWTPAVAAELLAMEVGDSDNLLPVLCLMASGCGLAYIGIDGGFESHVEWRRRRVGVCKRSQTLLTKCTLLWYDGGMQTFTLRAATHRGDSGHAAMEHNVLRARIACQGSHGNVHTDFKEGS